MKQYESDQLRVERRVAAQRARERGERLERIATAIAQGLWARTGATDMTGLSDHPEYKTMTYHQAMAITALRAAKALIAELDKQA